MPIYRYKCKDCENYVELRQKMSERKVPDSCESCGSSNMVQAITVPMFVLKGRGWAKDGYNYTKTPADSLPGYSDRDTQTILPSRKQDNTPPNPTTAPKVAESVSEVEP